MGGVVGLWKILLESKIVKFTYISYFLYGIYNAKR